MNLSLMNALLHARATATPFPHDPDAHMDAEEEYYCNKWTSSRGGFLGPFMDLHTGNRVNDSAAGRRRSDLQRSDIVYTDGTPDYY